MTAPAIFRRAPRAWSIGPRDASALYLLTITIIVFALRTPETFLTTTTLKTVLANEAVTGMVALGLVLPLSAGVFDLSIGGTVGLSGVLVAILQVEQGWPAPLAVAAALAAGVAVGLVNGLMVVQLRIDSFIATLATSSVLGGVVLWASGGVQIVGLEPGFKSIAQARILGLSLPVYYFLIATLALWVVLEHMPIGRYLQATGGGREAARLAGVQTNRYVFGSLVASAIIASFAGVVLTARIGTGSIDVGPKYLLPAYAAAFFGATQFKRGRPNAWGTWLAVYAVAVGVKGLELAQAGFWMSDVYYGVVLAGAVGFAARRRRTRQGEP